MSELIMAFGLGLMSAPHCIAMCGSVSSALLLATRPPQEVQPLRLHTPGSTASLPLRSGHSSALADAALLGGGKLLAYATLGAFAWAGGALLSTGGSGVVSGLRIFAALLMIAIGLYIPGWWRGLARLEAAGARLWRPVMQVLRQLPGGAVGNRLMAGAAWGLLPCGLVYSMLGLALSSGGSLQGASLMASFGLGTLPFVLGTGGLLQALGGRLANPRIRRLAGLMMIAMGVLTLLTLPVPGTQDGLQHLMHMTR